MTNNRKVGDYYEEWAVKYLESKGLKILERNFRFHNKGEIDIIAKDGPYLVFVEVKYRKTARAGNAAEAVNYKKIKQICKVADYYRLQRHLSINTSIRFDVVAIDGKTINWIKNAFYYTR